MVYAEAVTDAVVKILLRLPADLHATLVEMAQREQRSLHGQVLYLLRQGIERH